MTTIVLRVERVALSELDRRICELGGARLTRCDEGLFVECAAGATAAATRALARAGLRAVETAPPERPQHLVPGLAGDLHPLAAGGIVDIVLVRPLATSEATARLIRRRGILRRTFDREAVREVLHEADRLFGWRRIVWAPRRVLRSGALRGVRPVVFDRAAVVRGEERLAFASAAELTRWAS